MYCCEWILDAARVFQNSISSRASTGGSRISSVCWRCSYNSSFEKMLLKNLYISFFDRMHDIVNNVIKS